MTAADLEGFDAIDLDERPTLPAPRESGIRLCVEHVEWPAAIVDEVVCDLSRDPRSEDYAPERASNVSVLRRRVPRARRIDLPRPPRVPRIA